MFSYERHEEQVYIVRKTIMSVSQTDVTISIIQVVDRTIFSPILLKFCPVIAMYKIFKNQYVQNSDQGFYIQSLFCILISTGMKIELLLYRNLKIHMKDQTFKDKAYVTKGLGVENIDHREEHLERVSGSCEIITYRHQSSLLLS
jgi:hypothetical protein